jgi:hypothetical protein
MRTPLLLIFVMMAMAGTARGQVTNVNIGSAPNDRTGDPLRPAFQKLNANDNWLNGKIDAGSNAAYARDLISSNSLVAQITAASTALAGLLTSSSSAMAGVWLTHNSSNVFYGVDGTAFVNAYAAAHAGDRITLGPGTYVIGSYFSAYKSVDIVGAGAGVWDSRANHLVGGTILQGQMNLAATATNCLLSEFGIQNDQDVLMCGAYATNLMNLRYYNLAVGCTSGANGHNFFVTGAAVECQNIRSYNGGAHGIVFMGVSNLVARNLLSDGNRLDALIVKASQNQNGDVRDVYIQNVVARASGPIFVQAANENSKTSSVSNVQIQDVLFEPRVSGWAAFSVECQAGCSFSGLHVANVQVNHGCLAVVTANSTNFNEVNFDNCEVDGYSASGFMPVLNLVNPVAAEPSQFCARNIRVNQMTLDQIGNFTHARVTFTSETAPGLSVGLTASMLRMIYVLGGQIYVAWPANWLPATNCLATGDPVRLASGPLSGVYTNAGLFAASANNNPVPGIRTNDLYLILRPTTAADGLATNVDVAFGKILGRLASLPDSTSARVRVVGGGINNIANTSESGTASVVVRYASGNTAAYGTPSLSDLQPAVFPAYGYAWTAGDHVDIGVFAGGTEVPGWYPSSFRQLYADLELRGQLPAVIARASSW